jgi:hypothetical protein
VAKALDESKLRSRHRNAYIALYVIGGLTLLLGLVAELGQVKVLLELFGSGWIPVGEGIVLIVFGYLTMRGSLLALGVATGLYAVDAILTLVAVGLQGIVLRALVLFFLVQGFFALRELKRSQTAAAPPQEPTTS